MPRASLACAFLALALAFRGAGAVPSPRVGSIAGASRSSASLASSPDASSDLTPVPFEATPLPDPGAIATTAPNGELRWLGGFAVNFTGVDPDGRPWLDYGGWSSLVGSPDGRVLWTLTDNYARLLRVALDVPDERTGVVTGVRSIENATFAIRNPADAARVGRGYGVSEEGAEPIVTRIDVESLVAIPHPAEEKRKSEGEGDPEVDDANNRPRAPPDGLEDDSAELVDFIVGVEDSWELPANNLIRFRDGRARAWVDVPGADDALDACDDNLGPESLVWLPRIPPGNDDDDSAEGVDDGAPAAVFAGEAIVTFCETPAKGAPRQDAVRGFVFDVTSGEKKDRNAAKKDSDGSDSDGSDSDGSDSDAAASSSLAHELTLVGLGPDCGLSDATVTPDGARVLFLYHCYTYPPGREGRFGEGTHHSEIRVAADARALRVAGAEIRAELLARWSAEDGNPMTNMEGIHAFESGAGGGRHRPRARVGQQPRPERPDANRQASPRGGDDAGGGGGGRGEGEGGGGRVPPRVLPRVPLRVPP